MMIVYTISLLSLCFLVIIMVTCFHYKRVANNKGRKRDVIIVLGYHVRKDGNLSSILRERINKAAELYHEEIAKTVICTGAAVANDYIEADVMADALIELGVPDCDIICEKFAKNTYENLVNSKEIMQDKKLKTAVIVSSPWHLRKASSYAFKVGMDHTMEKSKIPHEYLIIGGWVIYLYYYTQMFINLFRYRKNRQ